VLVVFAAAGAFDDTVERDELRYHDPSHAASIFNSEVE